MPSPRKARSLTVAHGEIDASDKTTSLLFPSREHGPWLPFERFAETMTTSRSKLGRHSHQAEEVVIYLVEGEVDHMDGSGRREALTPGSVAVLTAHEEVSHDLEMLKGKRARWLSVVVRLPWHTEPPPTAIQVKMAGDATEQSDGTIQRPIVGPLARAEGSSGLECTDIEFARQATSFIRLGRDRRAVAYVLNGSGMIDDVPLKSGSGALLENMSAVAIGGGPGYRIVFASVPIPAPHEDPPDAVPRRVK
jgi:redox-sensitive bicupin YhaK (pirin superfamily)